LRITQSARKHRIGNAHILAALANAVVTAVIGDQTHLVGTDDRGIEIEMILVPDDHDPQRMACIHAMPTSYRK